MIQEIQNVPNDYNTSMNIPQLRIRLFDKTIGRLVKSGCSKTISTFQGIYFKKPQLRQLVSVSFSIAASGSVLKRWNREPWKKRYIKFSHVVKVAKM